MSKPKKPIQLFTRSTKREEPLFELETSELEFVAAGEDLDNGTCVDPLGTGG